MLFRSAEANIGDKIPTAKEKEVITMLLPDNGDWRADMECYDKVLAAYEERWEKTLH